MSNPPYFQPLALFLPNLPKSRKFLLPLHTKSATKQISLFVLLPAISDWHAFFFDDWFDWECSTQ